MSTKRREEKRKEEEKKKSIRIYIYNVSFQLPRCIIFMQDLRINVTILYEIIENIRRKSIEEKKNKGGC